MKSDTRKIIQHWRDAVPKDRLAHLVRDVSRAFTRSLTMRLDQHGVPFGQWTFLRVLWQTDGITQKELSERAGVMAPTTFIALKSMAAQGHIVCKQLPPNKKNVYVYLSAKGRMLKNKLIPLAVDSNNVSVEGISATDIRTTRQTLLAMLENLARDQQALDEPVKRVTPVARVARPVRAAKTSAAKKASATTSSNGAATAPAPTAKRARKVS
mgnify:CR=1 FL=1